MILVWSDLLIVHSTRRWTYTSWYNSLKYRRRPTTLAKKHGHVGAYITRFTHRNCTLRTGSMDMLFTFTIYSDLLISKILTCFSHVFFLCKSENNKHRQYNEGGCKQLPQNIPTLSSTISITFYLLKRLNIVELCIQTMNSIKIVNDDWLLL